MKGVTVLDGEVLFHIVPAFYPAFRCKAGECRHSCCRGWEIDIDENTLSAYQCLPGAWGERLRAAIVEEEENSAHFRLTEEENCPFLRPDGLCDVILALGEDALCDICALHPRFYECIGPYELCGLGLSCEAVCELLLDLSHPLRFLCEETGEELSLPALLSRLGFGASEKALTFTPVEDMHAMLRRLEKTEPIDALWTRRLGEIRQKITSGIPAIPEGEIYDRMLRYILYRTAEKIPEAGLPAVLAFGRESVSFIALEDALFGLDAEHLRRWSEQIEYSTENVDFLLSCL